MSTSLENQIAAAREEVRRLRQMGDRPALAAALVVLAGHLSNASKHNEAISVAQEAVDIYTSLTTDDPGNANLPTGWRRPRRHWPGSLTLTASGRARNGPSARIDNRDWNPQWN